jgi:hypothetical protein
MMNRMHIPLYCKILLLVFLCPGLMSFGPPTTTEKQHLARVSEFFDKLNTAAKADKNACYIDYTVTAHLGAKAGKGKNTVSKSSFKLLSSRYQSRVYSQVMVVLKDEKNTFMIIPSRKMIYWSDAISGKKEENLYTRMKQIQDTIFSNVKKVECMEVKDNKAYDQVITLELNEKASRFFDIQKAVYYLNSKTGMISRVYLEYLPDRQYKKLEYDFNEIVLHYDKENISTPVQKLVFENDKDLQKQYLGYKLIDNRKK